MQSSDPHRHEVWRLRKEETIFGTNPTAADPHTREAFQLRIYMECKRTVGVKRLSLLTAQPSALPQMKTEIRLTRLFSP